MKKELAEVLFGILAEGGYPSRIYEDYSYCSTRKTTGVVISHITDVIEAIIDFPNDLVEQDDEDWIGSAKYSVGSLHLNSLGMDYILY